MMKKNQKISIITLIVLILICVANIDMERLSGISSTIKEAFSNITNSEAADGIDSTMQEETEILSEMVEIAEPEYDTDVAENNDAGNEILHEVELSKVIDGDTIIVDTGTEQIKVRLIGIDTPESVHSDQSKNNEYGVMASDYTKTLLSDNDVVYLQYDKEQQDIYGRDLAYVWLVNNVDVNDREDIEKYMLNAILVEDGYAYDKVYEPNDKYADIFEELRTSAECSDAGLWSYPEFKELWK